MIQVASLQRSVAVARSARRPVSPRRPSRPNMKYADPLDQDRSDDPVVTMTERQLIRLVFIAAETSGRFERERIDQDPAAWMFASRRLFDGRAAVVACRERDAFVRALLLHGLSIGLDASPEAVDALIADDDVDLDAEVIRPKQARATTQLQPA